MQPPEEPVADPTGKPYQKLAWLATVMLLTSSILAAFNIYPFYVVAFVVSSGMWTLVACLWKEKSLIVVNGGLMIIYILGLIF
jgi:hypothetical protein